LLSGPSHLWLRDPTWLEKAVEVARNYGYSEVLVQTSGPVQGRVLEERGFELVDRLFVLFRPMSLPIEPYPESARAASLRRGRSTDTRRVIEVDNRCFEPFWQMNEYALNEALVATPRVRFRVLIAGDNDDIVGYAVFGLGTGEGYLQRIAVDPTYQGNGFATRLIVDGLKWAKRWRARRVGVNTQQRNERALRLYLKLGFELQNDGISIYRVSSP
jgi:ribosomal protein S18 acetylase RimI-like enzyme